jgi:hypothetical protein
MAKIEGEILIGRPVEAVFDFVADQRNEPQYNPRMVRAAKITDGPVGTGRCSSRRPNPWGAPPRCASN